MQKRTWLQLNSLCCVFVDLKVDWILTHRQGGHPGRPGLDPAPFGLEIGLAGVPSSPFLAVETVVILIYCMSFVLSVARHHDHQFKSMLLHVVHLI